MTRLMLVFLVFFFGNGSRACGQEEPFHWDTKCEQQGCMLFLDVLHGAEGENKAPDPKDSRQYISLMVALDRSTRKPAYIAFHFPPDADRNQGFFVGFVFDEKVNGKWTVRRDANPPLNLAFDHCDNDSCVARIREGKIDDEKGGFIDILGKFQSADHLWLMYSRNHQPIRTMIPLGPYKSAYQRVLDKEFAPQR